MGSFLACYDYGQGGIWFYVEGESIRAVTERYPGLSFFSVDPPWWTDEYEKAARENDPGKPPFKEILEGAQKK